MRGIWAGTVVVAMMIGALAAAAQGWQEPARGTATRKALMDAIRPHAEWVFGRPVEFVVDQLRVAGELGFASLYAQRPGGVAIDVRSTPGYRRDEISDAFGDPREIQVLYRKSGATWVAVHFAFGATDVWYSWEPLCREYHAVIPEVCP